MPVVTSSAQSFERNPGKPANNGLCRTHSRRKAACAQRLLPSAASRNLDHEQSGLECRRAPQGLAEHQRGGPVAEVKVRADVFLRGAQLPARDESTPGAHAVREVHHRGVAPAGVKPIELCHRS